MVISKKKGLHFNFLCDFAIFLPKSYRSLKKKSSLRFCLRFRCFSPEIIVISKKRSSLRFCLRFLVFFSRNHGDLHKKKKKVLHLDSNLYFPLLIPAKNCRFVRRSFVFVFLIGIVKGDGMPSKHPPSCAPVS